jgi:hypothetical protein
MLVPLHFNIMTAVAGILNSRGKKSCGYSLYAVQKTNRASRYTVLLPLALRPAPS